MSAAVLREAARLMRQRTEAATPGPWTAEASGSEGHHVFGADGTRAPLRGRARVAACHWQDWEETTADSAHIASWHPAVALAVADWLDAQAADVESFVDGDRGWVTDEWRAANDAALAVARVYLAPSRPAAAETAERAGRGGL